MEIIKSASIQRDDTEKRLERIEQSLGIKPQIKNASIPKQQESAWARLYKLQHGDLTYEDIAPEESIKSASTEPKEPAWLRLRRLTYGDV